MQIESKAKPSLETVKKLDAALTLLANKVAPQTQPKLFQQLGAANLTKLRSPLQQMKKMYPDAKATAEALAIGEKYNVTVK